MGLIGDIAGAIIGSKASKKASKAQETLGREAIAEESRQYDVSRADTAPWREEGGTAIHMLGDMLQPGYDYTKSPGYEFRRAEGQRGVENSAAARGILNAGGTLRGVARYNQDYAANDFTDSFNRAASVAAGGQQTNTALGQLGANKANSVADLLTQIGNAKASGYTGSANSWLNGINNFDNRLQTAMKMGMGG